MTDTKRHDR